MGEGTRVSGTTALAGVLGDPVRHSLSPAMHNAALAELGLDWIYLALPVAAAELAAALRGLEALDCRGLNVTLPHKQAAAALAAELTPLARRLGAVNTLVRRPAGGGGGGWLGSNTDVEGFLAPLREARGETGWRRGRALVLGCGGSARAVLAGLAELGLERIGVAGRRAAALEAFVGDCRAWAPGLAGLAWGAEAEGESGGTGSLGEALAACDLVVNTTPVGMAGAAGGTAEAKNATEAKNAAEACPLTEAELDRLPAGATVYDLIYTPRPTPLLRRAAARGCAVLDGLEMLVQQGAASLRLWSGRADVPVDAMRRAALRELDRRQGSAAAGSGYQAR
jgi:shikimate dehydrogenase